MTKKTILSVFIFLTFLVLSSCVFADNNLGDQLKDSWNKTEQTAQNVGGTVSNVINKDNVMKSTTTTRDTSNYEVTRTSTTDQMNGLSSFSWTWIILAITAAIIVGLIWYYGTQKTNETRIKDEN